MNAEWLPIAAVPEKLLVATVRDPMIHDAGGFAAHGAVGMLGQEAVAGFLPCGSVATIRSRWPPLISLCFARELAGALDAESDLSAA